MLEILTSLFIQFNYKSILPFILLLCLFVFMSTLPDFSQWLVGYRRFILFILTMQDFRWISALIALLRCWRATLNLFICSAFQNEEEMTCSKVWNNRPGPAAEVLRKSRERRVFLYRDNSFTMATTVLRSLRPAYWFGVTTPGWWAASHCLRRNNCHCSISAQ